MACCLPSCPRCEPSLRSRSPLQTCYFRPLNPKSSPIAVSRIQHVWRRKEAALRSILDEEGRQKPREAILNSGLHPSISAFPPFSNHRHQEMVLVVRRGRFLLSASNENRRRVRQRWCLHTPPPAPAPPVLHLFDKVPPSPETPHRGCEDGEVRRKEKEKIPDLHI
ncbi:uncharacterized protein BKA78DRAFT_118879 [Phyllosticta capitalensis]|uniref:uncharacterized protein n=1 Tax=Phyllosticta capitalensis TaxID=121624 RepID=UPI003131B23C